MFSRTLIDVGQSLGDMLYDIILIFKILSLLFIHVIVLMVISAFNANLLELIWEKMGSN